MTKKIRGRPCIYPPSIDTTKYVFHEKEVLTAEEVAAYTGYSKAYIYKLCHLRMIPHYNSHTGRKLYFVLHEIIGWCTANKIKTVYEIINKKNYEEN